MDKKIVCYICGYSECGMYYGCECGKEYCEKCVIKAAKETEEECIICECGEEVGF
jgi:hypothetical protein